VLKWIIFLKIISSSPFALLIINVKIFSNFQKEWCTFGRKKGHLKKTKIVHSQGLSVLNMQNLQLMENNSKFLIKIQTIMLSL
jgi:hypothetical protein